MFLLLISIATNRVAKNDNRSYNVGRWSWSCYSIRNIMPWCLWTQNHLFM